MAKAIVSTYKMDGAPIGSDTAVDSPAIIPTQGVEVIKLKLNKNQLQGAVREGNNLILVAGTDETNDKIVIEDFFTNEPKFVLEDEETGELAVASYDAENFNGLNFTPVENMDEVFAGTVDGLGGWVLPLVGVAAVGGIVAAVASDDDDKSDNGVVPPVEPPTPEEPETVWDVVRDFIQDQLAKLQEFVDNVMQLPSIQALKDIGEWIGSMIWGTVENIALGIKALASPFIELGNFTWAAIKHTGDSFIKGVNNFVEFIEDAIVWPLKLLTNPIGAIAELLNPDHLFKFIATTAEYFLGLGGLAVNGITGVIGSWLDFFSALGTNFMDTVKAFTDINFLDLLQLPVDLFSILGWTVSGGINFVSDFVQFIGDKVNAFFTGGLGIGKFFSELGEFAKATFTTIKDIVDSIFGQNNEAPQENTDPASKAAMVAEPEASEGFLSGLLKNFVSEDSFLGKIVSTIAHLIENGLNLFKPHAETYADNATAADQQDHGFIGNIISGIQDFLSNGIGKVINFIKELTHFHPEHVDPRGSESVEDLVNADQGQIPESILPTETPNEFTQNEPVLVHSGTEETLRALAVA